MELLKAFIEYVPDDIYESFTCLDLYNLASTHGELQEVLDEKTKQRYKLACCLATQKHNTVPTETQRATARKLVDAARSALLDEPDILEDLQHAVMDYKERIQTYLTMFPKRRPSGQLIDELEPTFTKTGVWYTVSLSTSSYAWIELHIRFMGLVVNYTYIRGSMATIREPYFEDMKPRPMDSSWKKSLALGVALLELVEIPYVLDNTDMLWYHDSEASVYNCLKHNCLPVFEGGHST